MVIDDRPLFIGGEWVSPASSRRFTILNASTGEALGSVPEAVEADADRAVRRPAELSRLGGYQLGSGRPFVGAYLVAHPGVDKVAFTGSTAAGRSIGKVCTELLRPLSLEVRRNHP